MLAAIDGIQRATAGKNLLDYCGDWLLRHAIEAIQAELDRRGEPGH